MLFTTRVRYQRAPDLEEEAHLLFVRYYIAVADQQVSEEQREQDFTLHHLIWEQSAPRGRSRTPMPVYSDVVRKRFCNSPHFSYWQAGDRNYFLSNDLIELVAT